MTVSPSKETIDREEELISCMNGLIWTIAEITRGRIPEDANLEKAMGICEAYANERPDKAASLCGGLAADGVQSYLRVTNNQYQTRGAS